ncbi:MAG TPA: hypothetical protein VKZ79_21500 [Alphaproteobacteria bacterium]|nr:hypothetical protein [Alphaproteobacteria bacterium]
MASPQTFPIVLLVTCFIVVAAAIIIAILLESVGFRQRYRLRHGASWETLSLSSRAATWVRERKPLWRPPARLKLRS